MWTDASGKSLEQIPQRTRHMAAVHGIAALAVALQIISAVMASTTESPPPPQAVARCSSVVRECWASGGLWANASCHAPLEQGPCADTHWLVLDANAMPRGKCEPRPCPPKQLPSQGRCLEEAEAREMCWSGAVHLDARGALRCGASPGWSAILVAHVRCEPLQQPTTNDGYYNRTDGGYYNYTDDGYYNYTDGGHYNYTDDDYYNYTDGGHYNYTDDGYYNYTDGPYYKHTGGGYYNYTDGGYYNHSGGPYYKHTGGGYYNYTDDGYYNHTYGGYYNYTDSDDYHTDGGYYNHTYRGNFNYTYDVYNSSSDYLMDDHPPPPPQSMHYKALATADDGQAVRAHDDTQYPPRAGSQRISSLSALSLAAGALWVLLATRPTF